MKATLKPDTRLPENISAAVLFEEGNYLPLKLTEAEEQLLIKKTDKGNACLIQRLPHFLFAVKIEEGKNLSTRKEKIRKAGAEWMEIVKKEKIDRVAVSGNVDSSLMLSFLEGFLLSGYAFPKYRKEKEDLAPGEIIVCHSGISPESLEELSVTEKAVSWARDLVNEPLSYLTAIRLSEEISEKGMKAGFNVEVFHKQKIEALKMGGLLGVNRGSIDPPTFTVMEWMPEAPVNSRPVVLVGKGVVYDTGGLSLKPTLKSMDYMKSDMAGAAAVAATLFLAASLKLPVHVVGLIPATDNRPDGNAITPGDVITISDGTTVEVMNTDAEGRLILADALAYAKRYQPQLVIDLATLTGAASIISGTQAILAMGNAPEFIDQLKTSGDEVFERIIELPLWDEFATPLKSDIADLSNTGGRDGQTIIAGKFLEHFIDYPWIHLDIAGTAYLFEKDGYRPKGSSGSGIRLLFNFLKNLK